MHHERKKGHQFHFFVRVSFKLSIDKVLKRFDSNTIIFWLTKKDMQINVDVSYFWQLGNQIAETGKSRTFVFALQEFLEISTLGMFSAKVNLHRNGIC